MYRPGTLYTTEPVITLDDDFWSLGYGKVMTHGIYDSKKKRGDGTLGNSKDTSEFACEFIKHWWNNYGKAAYPNANSILAKCDGGGSNNANHYILKHNSQKLVYKIGIELRIAHYFPIYLNRIPLKIDPLFQISRACQGVIFTSVDLVTTIRKKLTLTRVCL
ncbi:ISAzo13-like element transposase-related protein [Microcoleus sp. B9-D4]|uniref:ISAzo13-like element transposase-related protein n=1 Tax=Microcoleus sp. B9-D4 TaxID=2818711 RepID=UPI002FD165CE